MPFCIGFHTVSPWGNHDWSILHYYVRFAKQAGQNPSYTAMPNKKVDAIS